MNRRTEPTLAALLQEGLKTVTITRRGSQDRLAPNNYRLRVLMYRQPSPYRTRACRYR